jgi:hypothetical protein
VEVAVARGAVSQAEAVASAEVAAALEASVAEASVAAVPVEAGNRKKLNAEESDRWNDLSDFLLV